MFAPDFAEMLLILLVSFLFICAGKMIGVLKERIILFPFHHTTLMKM